MAESPTKVQTAWQPLTPKGVAAFADASLKRLLVIQFVFAVLIASAVVWFLDTAWFPIIAKAAQEFPGRGEIRHGRFDWPQKTPVVLAHGRFLALTIDLDHDGTVRSPADMQVELGRSDIRFLSLFGFLDVAYPKGKMILLDRSELGPWWGAWSPPILWMTFSAVIAGLIMSWALLATICFPITWLVGFFANRQLHFRGAWKVAGAASMPGAVLMLTAFLFYGFGILDLVQLVALEVVHLIIGLIYCLIAPWFVPQLPDATASGKNPFAG
jgi:hypothetical protein